MKGSVRLRRAAAGGLAAALLVAGSASATNQPASINQRPTLSDVDVEARPAPELMYVVGTIIQSYGSCPAYRAANSFIGFDFGRIPTTLTKVLVHTWVNGLGWMGGAVWRELAIYSNGVGGGWAIAVGPNPPAGTRYINHVTIAIFHPTQRRWNYGGEYVWKSGSSSGWCTAR